MFYCMSLQIQTIDVNEDSAVNAKAKAKEEKPIIKPKTITQK